MEKPEYYAVLPSWVRYDERLKPMEKIMYSELTVLSHVKGYCYANNTYFAKLYGVHKNTVSVWINNLVKCGHITTECIMKDKQVEERRIYIAKKGKKNSLVEEKEVEDLAEEKIVEENISEDKVEEEIEKELEGEEEEKTEKREKTPEELEEVRRKLLKDLFGEKFVREAQERKAEEEESKKVEEGIKIEEEKEESIPINENIDRVSQKTVMGNQKMVGVSTKTERGYQLKNTYPINKKIEDNITSRILQDYYYKKNIYYTHTYMWGENIFDMIENDKKLKRKRWREDNRTTVLRV